MICDCGGGTVDLTTYAITATEPVLAFEELVVGTGRLCHHQRILTKNNQEGNVAQLTSTEICTISCRNVSGPHLTNSPQPKKDQAVDLCSHLRLSRETLALRKTNV